VDTQGKLSEELLTPHCGIPPIILNVSINDRRFTASPFEEDFASCPTDDRPFYKATPNPGARLGNGFLGVSSGFKCAGAVDFPDLNLLLS
jgi:hypothetical protein